MQFHRITLLQLVNLMRRPPLQRITPPLITNRNSLHKELGRYRRLLGEERLHAGRTDSFARNIACDRD